MNVDTDAIHEGSATSSAFADGAGFAACRQICLLNSAPYGVIGPARLYPFGETEVSESIIPEAISPEGKVIYDRVCEVVRKCFPPSTRIKFAPGETRQSGRLLRVSVFAHVYAYRLNYDQKGLLARIGGITENATETEAEFSGKVERTDLRLRIATSEQLPSMAT